MTRFGGSCVPKRQYYNLPEIRSKGQEKKMSREKKLAGKGE